jgi:hypothetical protein
MVINVDKAKVKRISRESSPVQIMKDQKHLENVEYFKYLDSMTKNDAKCSRETKSKIAMAKAAVNREGRFTSKLDLSLREELVKCYIWKIALYGAETWTLRKVDQKHL